MNRLEPVTDDAGTDPAKRRLVDVAISDKNCNRRKRLRLGGILAYIVLLLLIFRTSGLAYVRLAAGSEVNSHIILVPFISAYLVFLQRERLPTEYAAAYGWGLLASLAGVLGLAMGRGMGLAALGLSENDSLSWMAFSFVCFVVAGGFFFLGRKWMLATAFPAAFLIFMIPLPDVVVDRLETASKLASTEAANLFFNLSGTPVLRDGTVFALPGMVIEVAQECSGIRSSLVLFITGLLAAQMFLKSSWRRAVLVAVVIPLGILRNGFRIMVIGMLCVHIGPQMIHSPIHHRGGPIFFVLSLVPFFLILWWLRRGETVKPPTE